MIGIRKCSIRKQEVSVGIIFDIIAGALFGGALGLFYRNYLFLFAVIGGFLGFIAGILKYYVISAVCK